jgi:hypothetical protein
MKKVLKTSRINIPLSDDERRRLDRAVEIKTNVTGIEIPTATWARKILMDAVDEILRKA